VPKFNFEELQQSAENLWSYSRRHLLADLHDRVISFKLQTDVGTICLVGLRERPVYSPLQQAANQLECWESPDGSTFKTWSYCGPLVVSLYKLPFKVRCSKYSDLDRGFGTTKVRKVAEPAIPAQVDGTNSCFHISQLE
jgi:hypothetical protein